MQITHTRGRLRGQLRSTTALAGVLGGVALAVVAAPGLARAAAAAAEPQGVQEVVVTARRKVERLQDVPVAVTAISGSTLEKYAVSDVQQITQLVPTMVVGRQVTGSSASIFLRGVGSSSLSSGFEQSVSLNLDGIPMSRGRELITTQYDVSQVEVLKGPQALFFGRNSTGGVITITTRDPTPEFAATGKVGYEFNANEIYGEAVVSGPITDSLQGRFAVRASRMDGWVKNVAQANSLYGGFIREPESDRLPESKALSARVTLRFAPPDSRFDATLKAQVTQIKDTGAGPYERLCGMGRTIPSAVLGVQDPNADCKVNGVVSTANAPPAVAAGLRWGRNGDLYTDHYATYDVLTTNYHLDKVDLTSVTAFYGFKQEDLNSFGSAAGTNLVTQYAKFHQVSEEVRAITDFEGPFNVTAGAIYLKSKFVFNTDAMVQPPVPDPTTGRFAGFTRDDGFDATTWSAFAELSWDILPTLELAGGARWTHEKKDSYQIPEFVLPTLRAAFGLQSFTDRFRDSNVSPQATLTWRPDTDHTYYVAYKEGFKSGGYNLSQTITAGTRRDDGSFKSEKAKGFEAGARTTWMNGALLLNATVYDYKYTDLQVQVFDALTSAQRVNNVGSLTVKGIEGQAVWRDAGIKGFDLNADVAYNHARFGTYANASCYTGQTVLGGCNASPGANGAFNTQDLSGRTPPKAPRWAGRIGASYTTEILGDYTLNLSGDARYSSKYNFTDALRPDAVQKGYARFDATVRLSPRDERWTIALIGRNLTEKWVISSANDMPLAGGGGTGTPAGFAPDMNTIVDRGRQVYLELSTRF